MSRPTRTLRLFRLQGGVRVPYVIELDSQLTVVSEYADMSGVDHVREGRRTDRKARDNDSPARRVSIAVAKWATPAVEENPIPDSEDLREEYLEDLQAMKDEWAKEDRECPPCEHGKLITRYRKKLEKAGLLAQLV